MSGKTDDKPNKQTNKQTNKKQSHEQPHHTERTYVAARGGGQGCSIFVGEDDCSARSDLGLLLRLNLRQAARATNTNGAGGFWVRVHGADKPASTRMSCMREGNMHG